MALDKQRILSELGSVVNQLQSAECGCMGKLFSDPSRGPSMGSYGGCRMGGCCKGHGSPYSGEPYSPMNNKCMNRPCMGQCNPPKLYADTYSYLNKNLMQPIVNEVYNDLKSISPANTVMNNPMASKMGLSSANQGMIAQGNISSISGGNPNQAGDMNVSPGYNVTMGNANATQPIGQQNQYASEMAQINQPMGQMGQSMDEMNPSANPMGGMGSHIMKMMMGDKPPKPTNIPAQNAQLNDSMIIDAPQSPHGQVGITPLNPANYGTGDIMQNANNVQNNIGAYAQNPMTQYMSQPNTQYNSQLNPNAGSAMPQNNIPQYNMTSNSSGMGQNVQGGQSTASNNRAYGQHSQGIKKFSEMFPGVMQGDLGFDPMAIAIQMNPANQQKAAMNSMQQLMNGKNTIDPNSSVMQPIVNATNAANQNIGQSNTPIQEAPMTQVNQQFMPSQVSNQNQTQPVQYQQPLQQPQSMQPQKPLEQQVVNSQVPNQNQLQPGQYQQQMQQPGQYQQPIQQQPPQQVYTAATGTAIHYKVPSNTPYQNQHQAQQYQTRQLQQQIIDPNTYSPNLSSGFDKMADPQMTDPNAQIQQSTPQVDPALSHKQTMIMEPIFPADTSKNQALTYSHHIKYPRNYYYNTLGQPVQMLDAKMYHAPEPTLPQTLSPQATPVKPRNNPQTFSNVKNTVSKTSIMGNGKVGRTPSRNQLQHLYNQYKGSQSFTQQNVNAPIHNPTYSEGRLNENINVAASRQVPVEKVGGDTIASNMVNTQMAVKSEQPAAPTGDVAPVGDVAVNKPYGDGAAVKETPMKMTKGRNGLQDMVYTSGPTSAAWSFHGHNHMPYSAGYRFKTKIR